MVGFRFRDHSQSRRRARWAMPIGALALLAALAGAPAAQAECNPTSPALGDGLTQPADACPLIASYTASPTQVLPGGTVNFDGVGSSTGDPAGITEYAWDFDGDGIYDVTKSDPNDPAFTTVSHSYPTRGRFYPVLRVKDAGNPSGVVSSQLTSISVGAPPVAQFSVTPGQAQTGQSILLDATGSTADPAGNIDHYDWDFEGDGAYDQTTLTPTVSHV